MKTYEITTYQREYKDHHVGNASIMFKGKEDEAIEIAVDLVNQPDIDGVVIDEIRPIKVKKTIFNKTPKSTRRVEVYSNFDDDCVSDTNYASGLLAVSNPVR